jgi:hypothetical protein
MPDGSDFIMGPIMAGMCKYESAKDGTLGLMDFWRMNDALAVRSENMRPNG